MYFYNMYYPPDRPAMLSFVTSEGLAFLTHDERR